MQHNIKVFAAFLLTVLLALGTQAAPAFAASDTSTFTLNPGARKIVPLNSSVPAISAQFTNNSSSSPATIMVGGGSCSLHAVTILPGARNQFQTLNCGRIQAAMVMASSDNSKSVEISFSQSLHKNGRRR